MIGNVRWRSQEGDGQPKGVIKNVLKKALRQTACYSEKSKLRSLSDQNPAGSLRKGAPAQLLDEYYYQRLAVQQTTGSCPVRMRDGSSPLPRR